MFLVSLPVSRCKGSTASTSELQSSYIFLDKKPLLKIWLNADYGFRGTRPCILIFWQLSLQKKTDLFNFSHNGKSKTESYPHCSVKFENLLELFKIYAVV